jgi:dipeptidyl-peptidase III
MKHYLLPSLALGLILTLGACKDTKKSDATAESKDSTATEFNYVTEQFADLRILRYQVPGFDQLSAKQKELAYYLYEAALAGRDIIWDQNNKYNLSIRRTLEAILNSASPDTTAEDFKKFMVYTKQIWFSNGIHHHYSSAKIMPEFSAEYFAGLVKKADAKLLPLRDGESADDLLKRITPVMFDAKVAAKKVNLDPNVDMVASSATNFYEGVTQKEAVEYYKTLPAKYNNAPYEYGINTKLMKENGKLVEKVYKVGGMYSAAIEKIVYWLEKALPLAEDEAQKASLAKLIAYHKTGDLKTWNEYNIAWVKDVTAQLDVVNGHIEVYGDPLGHKGSFESMVSMKDMEASNRIETISKEAQWFEDNSPIKPEHKKKNVTGITAKVITVIVESGDASPSTPIGVNLPNNEWIRENHGSKSVNLGNIVNAYDMAKGGGMLKEFAFSEEEITLEKEHGAYGDMLHTDMHEVIGHASGQINKGVEPSHVTLKNYASTLEEARADLVALYYLYDQKLIDLGLMKSLETGKAAYNDYIRNGMMTQLVRLKLGDNVEEAHMRNRQLIAKWAFEKGAKDNVIEKKTKDGKTFFVVNDYAKLKELFGELLREIQRIKSEGDYAAGKALVENYGVKVDPALHKEVLERYSKLNIAPYAGFINPRLVPVMEGGKITDVKVEYPADFKEQMLYYAKQHSFLPSEN